MATVDRKLAHGRALLRHETLETHERMHGLSAFRRIEAGTLGRADYARLLRALHCFHAAVSDALSDTPLEPLSAERDRLDRLEADLAALGGEPPATADWCSPTGDGLLGTLYVVTGSMLGGRVIARQLDYLLGSEEGGRRFFRGSGDDSRRWQAVVRRLDQAPRTENTQAAMVAGAEATFLLFEDCVRELA